MLMDDQPHIVQQVIWPFIILSVSLYGINASNKLIICSIFFILSLIFSLKNLKKHVINKGFVIISAAILANLGVMCLLGNDILLYSFLPFTAAVLVSYHIGKKFKEHAVFMSLFVPVICGIVTDALLIAPWEYFHFGAAKLPMILVKSIAFKSFYAFIAASGVFLFDKFIADKALIKK